MAYVAYVAVLALALLPIACKSHFPLTVVPDKLPVGEVVDISVHSNVLAFSTAASYSIILMPAGSTRESDPFVCTVIARSSLNCNVTWASAGSVAVRATELLSGQSRLLGWFILGTFHQPPVVNESLAQLKLFRGSLISIKFEFPLTLFTQPIVMRLFGPNSNYADVDMTVNTGGTEAIGRVTSLPLGVAATDSVRAHLALNRHSFMDTGLTLAVGERRPLRIGFLFPGKPDDFGWTFQLNDARLQIESRFDGQVETLYEQVEEWGPNECKICATLPEWNSSREGWVDEPRNYVGTHRAANVIRKWIMESNVTMIFACSWYYQWDAYHMAAYFPHVNFVHVGGWLTRDNMAQVFPKVSQARYLAGIALAWYIKKHNLPKRVGYVAAFKVGETVRGINAFKLGLEQVDPEIDIYLSWILTWSDERKEQYAADRLIRLYGVEAIVQHTNSIAPQIAAKNNLKVGVGYNADMRFAVGDSVLTSTILVWDRDFGDLVQRVLDGKNVGAQSIWHGAEKESWRLADMSPLVPVEAKRQISSEIDKFRRGEDTIFCRSFMMDNRGRCRNCQTNPAVNTVPWEVDHLIPGTTCLTDPVIKQVCQEYIADDCRDHWLLAGVHDNCDFASTGYPADILPNGVCFLGIEGVPPDECPNGQYLSLMGCTRARLGKFSPAKIGSERRDESEYNCPKGTYANVAGLMQCHPCAPGSYAANVASTACALCEAGWYSAIPALSACAACRVGTFSTPGLSSCVACERGRYSSQAGSTACIACEGIHQVTLDIYSKSKSDCVCDDGFFLKDRICSECSTGLRCNSGSVRIRAGYFAWAADDVYRCYGPDGPLRCHAGLAGIGEALCAEGRTGLVCAECHHGMMSAQDGKCVKCVAFDIMPFIVVILASIPVLSIAYCILDKIERATLSRGALIFAISLGQLVTLSQQVSLISLLSVKLVDPAMSFVSAFKVLAFDIELLRLGCVTSMQPWALFLARASFILLGCILFLIIHAVVAVLRHGGHFRTRARTLISVIGTIFTISYISIVSNILAPFQCERHPNSKWTTKVYANVVCHDQGGDHSIMIIIAGFALLLPVGYFALCVFAVCIFPKKMSEADTTFLDAFSFLFLRFKAETYWYMLVLLTRSLMMAIVPVIPGGFNQILLLQVILLVSSWSIVHHSPWRVKCSNYVDFFFANVMLILLSLSSFFVADEIEGRTEISWYFVMLIICSFLTLPIVIACNSGIHCQRRKKQYRFFLCRHKASAGAYAHLLKIHLQEKTMGAVFVDADHFCSLEEILNIVATETESMLVLATKQLFLQPSCVGEMVTARPRTMASTMTMILISMPDFSPLDADLIDDYRSAVHDIQILTVIGISLDMIKLTLNWINTLPVIGAPAEVNNKIMRDLVSKLASGWDQKDPPDTNQSHTTPNIPVPATATWIIANHESLECASSAFILHKMLLPFTVHESANVPFVLPKDRPFPETSLAACIMCSSGCFVVPSFADQVVGTARLIIRRLPVVIEETFRFPTGNLIDLLRDFPPTSRCGNGLLANLVQDLFKEMAPVFQPSIAGNTLLQAQVTLVASRLTSAKTREVVQEVPSQNRFQEMAMDLSNSGDTSDAESTQASRIRKIQQL